MLVRPRFNGSLPADPKSGYRRVERWDNPSKLAQMVKEFFNY